MLLITSFNENLLKQYGERMVKEFSEKSDGSVKLVVIYEAEVVPEIYLKNIEFINSIIRDIMNLFENSVIYTRQEDFE